MTHHVPTLQTDQVWVLSFVHSTAAIPTGHDNSVGDQGGKGNGLTIPWDSHCPPGPAAPQTTDKHWQMDSTECFLHTCVIPAITLVLQSFPLAGSPGTLINVKKPLAEMPASCEGGVGCGGHSAHCCYSGEILQELCSASGAADGADLCRERRGPASDYRPQRRGAGAPERDQAVHTGMGNALVNRQDFFSSGQETQICRCGTADRHQKLPGKCALVKYGIHFTPQFGVWGRATVWMHNVWARTHACSNHTE